jgi:tetratricopeptide (TPR) repeat protein
MISKSSKKGYSSKQREVSPFMENIKKSMDEAIQLLYSKNKKKAREAFESIISQYPEEKMILDRCRIYINICNRMNQTAAESLNTAEEFYARGSMRMNQGDLDGAIDDFQSSIKLSAKGDHIHYTLAAAYALKHNPELSAKHLAKAIQINPDNREFVLNDADFQDVFGTPAFEAVLETNA